MLKLPWLSRPIWVPLIGKHIPENLSYDRRGVGEGARSSLDWERVIGSYHGRMIASVRLDDDLAARNDARALVSYVKFVLGLQSFSRNETRELIGRVARPALNKALGVLVDGRELAPNDLEAVFQIVQMMQPSGTGATIAHLGARLSAVSPELANLAKQREERRQKWLAVSADRGGSKSRGVSLGGGFGGNCRIDHKDVREPGQRQGQILFVGSRDAMRELRAGNMGKYAHPLYWGPFEVAGAD